MQVFIELRKHTQVQVIYSNYYALNPKVEIYTYQRIKGRKGHNIP